jgi:hypothetical protein
LNVTVVNATASSFLTVWPSDEGRPLASSLNWVAGAPATPNKVDVKLSADGKISLFNLAGTVDVLADVVGYYSPATVTTTASYTLSQAAFRPESNTTMVVSGGCAFGSNNTLPLTASVEVPVGATITSVNILVYDGTDPSNITVTLGRVGFETLADIGSVSSTGNIGEQELTMTLPTPEVVSSGEYFTLTFHPTSVSPNQHQICGAEVFYTIVS